MSWLKRQRGYYRGTTTRLVAAVMIIGGAGTLVYHVRKPPPQGGNVITASSCSSSDVQSAIGSSVTGDTVELPAPCSATWDPGAVTIPDTKAITLDGNGAVITRSDSSSNVPVIQVTAHASEVTRVTEMDMRYVGTNANGAFLDVYTSLSDTAAPLFRVDHNTFNSNNVYQLRIIGAGHGLIDHNTFLWSGNNEVIHILGWGPGDTTGWSNDVYPGTERMTYVEDNTFINSANPNWLSGKTAAFYGARSVFRFNTLHMTTIDNHGTGGSVGARWWEIYKNNFTVGDGEEIGRFIQQRAGSGVIFDNPSPAEEGDAQDLTLWEEDTGYPAAYQIGRGKCTGSPCTSGSNQSLEPAYIWLKDADMPLNVQEASASQIVANRDYYIQGASFNGTSGVGVGTIASRPSTCTTGVAYWATDEGEWWAAQSGADGRLYKCTATNTWTLHYTPYVYPHPLQGSPPAPTILADCSQTTVQAAINASSDGDTLVCPAGSWSWSNVDLVNRNITLKGAGVGNTNISITAAGGIETTSSNTKAFRITGFTFISTANFGTDGGFAMMRIQGGKGWRIDNNEFQIYSNVVSYDGGNAIYTDNDIGGLIDNNSFLKGGGSGCMHASVYVEGDGNNSWTRPSQIGSADRTVFVEDNYFYNPDSCGAHNAHAIYAQNGGIVVARHNEIHGMNVDSHGFCATHGTREFEFSNNTWIGVSSFNLFSVLHIRGGTGVIYNNTWSGNISIAYWLEDYRAEDVGCGYSGTSFVPGYGDAPANQSCPEGYPCAQQIGRGQNNGSDPMYIWNNSGTATLQNEAPSYIQSGRDYFLNQGAKPGYTAYPYPHPLRSQ